MVAAWSADPLHKVLIFFWLKSVIRLYNRVNIPKMMVLFILTICLLENDCRLKLKGSFRTFKILNKWNTGNNVVWLQQNIYIHPLSSAINGEWTVGSQMNSMKLNGNLQRGGVGGFKPQPLSLGLCLLCADRPNYHLFQVSKIWFNTIFFRGRIL